MRLGTPVVLIEQTATAEGQLGHSGHSPYFHRNLPKNELSIALKYSTQMKKVTGAQHC